MPVTQNLELDMTRSVHQALEVDLGVGKTPLRHGSSPLDRTQQFLWRPGGQHADAAPTRSRLHQDGVANGLGRTQHRVGIAGQHGRSQPHRHAMPCRQFAGAGLVAHGFDPMRGRPDETGAGGLDLRRKDRVLGQKSITRVQPVGTGPAHHLEQLVRVQIAFACRCRADAQGFLRQRQIGRVGIGFGVHRHRGHPQRAQRTQHPGCDCTPIGDHDLLEHGHGQKLVGQLARRCSPMPLFRRLRCRSSIRIR